MVSLSDNPRDAIPPAEPLADYEIAARDLAALADKLALTVECAFVPFSRSRNAGEAHPSLNWRCAILRNGKPVKGLEAIDYMQGSGHCPANKVKAFQGNRFAKARAIAIECDSGWQARPNIGGIEPYQSNRKIAPPALADVLSAIARDTDVLDYACFEDWAAEIGFDPDSRKGEATYRACLAYALALRAAIGDEALQSLRDLAGQM